MPTSTSKSHANFLLRCEKGTVVTTELVLVAVVAAIALIVAFVSLRDAVVSEVVDTSLTLQSANQSYTYNGAGNGVSSTAGSNWTDLQDVGDGPDVGGAVVGVDFSIGPTDESDLAAFLESKTFQFEMSRFGATWSGTGTFANGVYTGSPYWPGTYSIVGTTIEIVLNALGGGWNDGTITPDASDPDNITGNVIWINVNGWIWEAAYRLFCP